MERPAQRPLELILARNLMSTLSTAAFLVNRPGDIIFYNDAAATLLGRRFEEQGSVSAQDWVETVGPFDDDGNPIPIDEQPLTIALRANRPAHTRNKIRAPDGGTQWVEVSGLPVVGTDGFQGAMVFIWPAEDPDA